MSMTRKVPSVCLLAVVVCVAVMLVQKGRALSQQKSGTLDRVVLDNGLTVLLCPVPGADRVAVESFYRVGFLHEPKGMTQAAHLVEHLVCQGATENYPVGESMRLLSQKGMVNAETLADFTHYDYVLPADGLELALQIEAERLSSLKITEDLMRQEAPKCYQEAATVEQNPQAGMFKHAFMAFGQAWGHGLGKARVRGGLEDIPVADLEGFHRAFYHPGNLLLVVVGGFGRDEALELVNKHLGSLKPPQTPPPQPVPWAQVPKARTVEWDSQVRAVCLGFPPPEDETDRVVLSLWGNLLMQRLMADRQVQAAVSSVFCTNQLWGVGTLPFFVYATTKPNTDLQQLQSLLSESLQSIVAAKPGDAEVAQLRLMAGQLGQVSGLTWEAVRQQAQSLATQMGQDPQQATGMVMGNVAIQLGAQELSLGADSARKVEALKALTAEDLSRLLRRTLDPARQFVTLLAPVE